MPQRTTPSSSSALTIELTAVGGGGERPCFPREQDKKHRRMIANSNERRRMQSINAGFQMLKNLIKPLDGEKLSKASVLQQAVDHIRRLEMEKTFLLAENKRLEHLVCSHSLVTGSSYDDGPVSKRRKLDTESSDEGVSMIIDEALVVDELRRQLDEVRQRLECERQTRALLEQQKPPRPAAENHADRPTDSFPPDVGIRYSVSAPAENVGGLRGSLETIVEAIQHLEEAQTTPRNSPLRRAKSDDFASEDDDDHDDSNSSARSVTFRGGAALQLPATELMRVVAAAEALQCFARRQEEATTHRTPQSFPCILQPIRSSVGSKLHHRLMTHPQRLFHSS